MASGGGGETPVGLALRVAVASVTCLLVAEYFRIDQTSLSVYTAFLVMALFPITSFQKGTERFLGRVLGLAYGMAVIWFAWDAPALYIVLIALGQMVACYVYLSGRLAYAALMGAIFSGVIAAMGVTAPASTGPYFVAAAVQLALGEAAAFGVNFVTGAERTLAIQVQGEPLLPLRPGWVNTAAMLAAGQMATLFATLYFELPVTPTMVSAMIIGIVPGGLVEEWKKAKQRTLGALLGGGCALVSIVLLTFQPYLPLLALLVFVIMFTATYFTKVSKNNSYAFLQMGLVTPMVLIGQTGEIGSVGKALQRLVGIGAGLVAAGLVSVLWPHTPIGTTAAPVAPATPAAPAGTGAGTS